jgi:hypothetical protein
VFDNYETAFVSGGTGRFTNATGQFALLGQVDFNTLSFVLPLAGGTISSVGSPEDYNLRTQAEYRSLERIETQSRVPT